MGHIYKKCCRCKVDKKHNRSAYCLDCSRNYYKTYRTMKESLPNINNDGLGDFIGKIKYQQDYLTFEDISTIIFFYQIITTSINEYDSYRSGRQIVLMWERLLSHHESNK